MAHQPEYSAITPAACISHDYLPAGCPASVSGESELTDAQQVKRNPRIPSTRVLSTFFDPERRETAAVGALRDRRAARRGVIEIERDTQPTSGVLHAPEEEVLLDVPGRVDLGGYLAEAAFGPLQPALEFECFHH